MKKISIRVDTPDEVTGMLLGLREKNPPLTEEEVDRQLEGVTAVLRRHLNTYCDQLRVCIGGEFVLDELEYADIVFTMPDGHLLYDTPILELLEVMRTACPAVHAGWIDGEEGLAASPPNPQELHWE